MGARGFIFAVIISASAFALTACANGAAPPGSVSLAGAESGFPEPQTTKELIGQGLVIQYPGEDPQLCMGAIGASDPPTCSGPAIHGWDWTTAEQSETAADTTSGGYAVYVTWDGVSFTSTRDPIPLSLYDAMAIDDPRLDDRNPGKTSEAELIRLMDDVYATRGPTLTNWMVRNGYLWLDVIYDDGTVQDFVDEKYGEGVVVVQSVFRPVE